MRDRSTGASAVGVSAVRRVASLGLACLLLIASSSGFAQTQFPTASTAATLTVLGGEVELVRSAGDRGLPSAGRAWRWETGSRPGPPAVA